MTNQNSALQAGAYSQRIDPPYGVDLVGFLRKWEPMNGFGQPLEVGVVVLDDGSTRTAIASVDTGSLVGEFATRARQQIAEAADTPIQRVLVNASHTHSAPPLPGNIKTGGSTADLRPLEDRYAEQVLDALRTAASAAVQNLRPAVVGLGTDDFAGGVNRRQRTPEGGTIMGWNPDGPVEQTVSSIRIDGIDGGSIATLVSYACHPTVLGPSILHSCSDFVGPLRETVRQHTGGECLFLQGCAGDIFPLEAMNDSAGPEETFGRGLGISALRARERAVTVSKEPQESRVQSAQPIALWRLVPTDKQPSLTLDAAETTARVPLQALPSSEEIAALRKELSERLAGLQADGQPRSVWNATWLHLEWAQQIEARIASGNVSTEVDAPVQAISIGDITIVALPCEPFTGIGRAIRQEVGDDTVVLGYSNGMIGYVPTADEFAHGGYEPWLAPRHFGMPAPFDPSAASVLADAATELAKDLRATLTR